MPPTIYGLPKDHKSVNPGEEHPFRPVCSGDTGPDAKHANVMSMVINPVNEEFSEESQVESTEDLTAHLAQFNEDMIREILDLYGTDAKALYPSLGVDKSADAVEELMEKSSLNIKNIDFIELGRLMAYTVPHEKLEEKCLTDFVSKRKSSGGRKPKVTGRELDKRFSTMRQSESIWHPPEKEPEGALVKQMIATAVAEEVRFILKSHTFRYGDRLVLQEEGGAIGSELTCVVSKTRIILFTWKLKELLAVIEKKWFRFERYERKYVSGTKEYLGWRKSANKDIKLVLSKWYVDDNTVISSRIPKGWRYNSQLSRMEWRLEWEEEDAALKPDCVTAKVMASIMSSIDPDIQLTWDAPGNNPDGRMPVLDLKLWLESDENGVNRVRFCFYEKPMASQYVIKRESALPWQVKKMTLAGEVARRCLNMDTQAWEEEGCQVMDKFNFKMLSSGYTEHERRVIVKEGLARVTNLKAKVSSGKRPLYRKATWRKEERGIQKKLKAKRWAGSAESVVFVQSTPNEILKRSIQEVANESAFKIRVVERGGRTLKSMLQKSDIIPNKKCWDNNCPVCTTEEKGLCCHENAGYSIQCLTCWNDPNKVDKSVKERKYVMHGETNRTARVRCLEHKSALLRRDNSNLWEHCVAQHSGQQAEFGYKVTRGFHRDSLLRQIDEAWRLENEEGTILNDKLEFVKPFGIQLKATRMGSE